VSLTLVSCEKFNLFDKIGFSTSNSKLKKVQPLPNVITKVPILQVVTDVVVIDPTTGTGPTIQLGDEVSLNYSIFIYDPYLPEGRGAKIESSVDSGAPLKIKLGTGSILKAWQDNIPGMKSGGKRILLIPPKQAYGEIGIKSKIPSHAPLLIEMDLL
jgi:FKBP-type peptidyl-prolyl cis-trans isomerase FkpA